jgi:hypothetical protein
MASSDEVFVLACETAGQQKASTYRRACARRARAASRVLGDAEMLDLQRRYGYAPTKTRRQGRKRGRTNGGNSARR